MLLGKYLLAVGSVLAIGAQGHPTNQFKHTESTWWPYMSGLLTKECQSPFNTYEADVDNSTSTYRDRVLNVLECVLGAMTETRKANLAASAVIMGSAPLVLQTLGSSSIETALLGLRRPFLALLLSASSPAVTTMKGSEYIEVLSTFVEGGETRHLALPGFGFEAIPVAVRPLISVVEYVMVGGALANVMHLGYRLGYRAVVIFAPTTRWMPPLWIILVVVLHLGGTIALHLRVRLRKAPSNRSTYRWAPDELVPSAYQPRTYLTWRKENAWFYGLTWILSVATVTNLIFGTLIFASLLFFSIKDAIYTVSRFAASATIARAVVRFELAGMTEVTKYQRIKDEQLSSQELAASDDAKGLRNRVRAQDSGAGRADSL